MKAWLVYRIVVALFLRFPDEIKCSSMFVTEINLQIFYLVRSALIYWLVQVLNPSLRISLILFVHACTFKYILKPSDLLNHGCTVVSLCTAGVWLACSNALNALLWYGLILEDTTLQRHTHICIPEPDNFRQTVTPCRSKWYVMRTCYLSTNVLPSQ